MEIQKNLKTLPFTNLVVDGQFLERDDLRRDINQLAESGRIFLGHRSFNGSVGLCNADRIQ